MPVQHDGGTRSNRNRWLALPSPRRTVRLRLTALYGVLFFLSGAVLLAIAGGFAVNRSSTEVAGAAAASSGPTTALANAQARIQELQHQLANAQGGSDQLHAFSRNLIIASVVALGLMTVVSVVMGWFIAGPGAATSA